MRDDIVGLIKFVFDRYAAGSVPTTKQIQYAIKDFGRSRKMKEPYYVTVTNYPIIKWTMGGTMDQELKDATIIDPNMYIQVVEKLEDGKIRVYDIDEYHQGDIDDPLTTIWISGGFKDVK